MHFSLELQLMFILAIDYAINWIIQFFFKWQIVHLIIWGHFIQYYTNNQMILLSELSLFTIYSTDVPWICHWNSIQLNWTIQFLFLHKKIDILP